MSSAYGYENFLFQVQKLLDTLCNYKLINRTPLHDIRPTSVVQHRSVIRLFILLYQLNPTFSGSRTWTRMAIT